jgi:hypothetical protein
MDVGIHLLLLVWWSSGGAEQRLFIYIFSKNIFYKNIFLVS